MRLLIEEEDDEKVSSLIMTNQFYLIIGEFLDQLIGG